jgi:hypothetical protein
VWFVPAESPSDGSAAADNFLFFFEQVNLSGDTGVNTDIQTP